MLRSLKMLKRCYIDSGLPFLKYVLHMLKNVFKKKTTTAFVLKIDMHKWNQTLLKGMLYFPKKRLHKAYAHTLFAYVTMFRFKYFLFVRTVTKTRCRVWERLVTVVAFQTLYRGNWKGPKTKRWFHQHDHHHHHNHHQVIIIIQS